VIRELVERVLARDGEVLARLLKLGVGVGLVGDVLAAPGFAVTVQRDHGGRASEAAGGVPFEAVEVVALDAEVEVGNVVVQHPVGVFARQPVKGGR
jgi:hypothetical protein